MLAIWRDISDRTWNSGLLRGREPDAPMYQNPPSRGRSDRFPATLRSQQPTTEAKDGQIIPDDQAATRHRRDHGGQAARHLRLRVLRQEPAPPGLRQPAKGAPDHRQGGRRQLPRRLRGSRHPPRHHGRHRRPPAKERAPREGRPNPRLQPGATASPSSTTARASSASRSKTSSAASSTAQSSTASRCPAASRASASPPPACTA
jgi:hypothetical protein